MNGDLVQAAPRPAAEGTAASRRPVVLVTGLSGAAPGPEFVLAAPSGVHAALHDELLKLDAAGGP
jgi:myo-inositol-1(or 4)-monophosphatase